MVELISQTSANTVRERLPHRAKAATKYTEGKVRSGDLVDSDGSEYSPHSGGSDEDDDLDTKPRAEDRVANTKSPSRKEPVLDVDEEEVSII